MYRAHSQLVPLGDERVLPHGARYWRAAHTDRGTHGGGGQPAVNMT